MKKTYGSSNLQRKSVGFGRVINSGMQKTLKAKAMFYRGK
jgi:hypothetical protein